MSFSRLDRIALDVNPLQGLDRLAPGVPELVSPFLASFLTLLLFGLFLSACAPASPANSRQAGDFNEPLLLLGDGTADWLEEAVYSSDHLVVNGSFHSFDGTQLPLRAWMPYGEPAQAVVLALHGFNDYTRAFEPLGRTLASRGIAVYAYDQRGFGAGPNVGLWAGTLTMAADLRAAAARLRDDHPGVPLFILGESMGGAVVLAAEAAAPLGADGLVLSAPAVWGRETQPWYQRAALWLALRTVPWYQPSPRGLDIQASDNIEMLRALGQDPLVMGSARIDAIAGLVDLMDAALEAAPVIYTPTLLLYGERDEIVPPEPIERLWHDMPESAGHRFVRYPEGWHLLTRDLQGPRVIDDIAAWIEDPQAPLPSTDRPLLPVARGEEIQEGEG